MFNPPKHIRPFSITILENSTRRFNTKWLGDLLKKKRMSTDQITKSAVYSNRPVLV